MHSLADLLLAYVPFPHIPHYLTTYVPGKTPLSTTSSVLTALTLYLVTIFGVQAMMRKQAAQKLTLLFRAHNIFLSVGSLILLALMLEEILPVLWRKGLFVAMCADESWTPVNISTCFTEQGCN
jgi:fatty acid elongase 3